MNSITELLQQQLSNQFIEKTSKALNTDPKKIKTGFEKSLPFLMGALTKNTQSTTGTASLEKALAKHKGDIFKHVNSLVQHPEKGEGVGILNHLLGDKNSGIEKYVGSKSGLGSDGAKKILQILAPMVLGALGQEKLKNNFSTDQLQNFIKDSSKQLKTKQGLPMTLVMNYLDKDKDGDIKDDLFSLLLSKFRG